MHDLKPHAVICVSLTNLMLNERSQTQNSAYCIVTFMLSTKQQNYPVLPRQWGLVPEKEHIRLSQVVVCLTVWVLTTWVFPMQKFFSSCAFEHCTVFSMYFMSIKS